MAWEKAPTPDFAPVDLQLMSVQSNTLGRYLDADLDLHNPLKAKGAPKLKVEQLNVVVDCLDTEFVITRPLQLLQ